MNSSIQSYALRLLTHREYSRQELQHKLQMRGYSAAAIDEVLTELAARALQSDHRFAETYSRNRRQKGFGPLRIHAELRRHGVAEDVIHTVLTQDASCWLEQAEQVRRKKFGVAVPRDRYKQLQQHRFLQNRGFSAEQIRQIFRSTADSLILDSD